MGVTFALFNSDGKLELNNKLLKLLKTKLETIPIRHLPAQS